MKVHFRLAYGQEYILLSLVSPISTFLTFGAIQPYLLRPFLGACVFILRLFGYFRCVNTEFQDPGLRNDCVMAGGTKEAIYGIKHVSIDKLLPTQLELDCNTA